MLLETASPLEDPRIGALLDLAFQRAERESTLVAEFARHDPAFDRGLSLCATVDGGLAGYALFLPRELRLRGRFVRLAILSPLAVHPAHRGRGVGQFLVRAGLAALGDRGIVGAVVLGEPGFYARFGFESAFDAHTLRIPVQALPEEGDTSSWRGLRAADLAALCALQEHDYAAIDGSERRHRAPLDWESSIPTAFTLVSERAGAPEAWLRFRVRSEIEISECAARDERGRDAILRFARRLLREHRRGRLDAHLAARHPLARELLARGAVLESHHLGGAAQLCLSDPQGFLRGSAASWLQALERARVNSASFELGGQPWRLVARGAQLEVRAERDPERHLAVPRGWSSGLISGQRDHLDLARVATPAFDERQTELAAALFPGGTPMWSYSPAFERVDE